jgi:hypothetical protein
MTTIEISADTPASPISRLEGMRVCAVVIALSPCMTLLPLSNATWIYRGRGLCIGNGSDLVTTRPQSEFALVRPVGHTAMQAVNAAGRRSPWDLGVPRAFFVLK